MADSDSDEELALLSNEMPDEADESAAPLWAPHYKEIPSNKTTRQVLVSGVDAHGKLLGGCARESS